MTTAKHVGIKEAATMLGVSQDTIRRRLRRGTLKGEQVERPQGFTWAVHIEPQQNDSAQLMELVAFLREQIAVKDGQIGELTYTLRVQAKALPAPRSRNWWQRLFRRYN